MPLLCLTVCINVTEAYWGEGGQSCLASEMAAKVVRELKVCVYRGAGMAERDKEKQKKMFPKMLPR